LPSHNIYKGELIQLEIISNNAVSGWKRPIYFASTLPNDQYYLPRMAAIVRATGCGIVVPHDDPAAHAAAIRHLLQNPDEARAMGAAGRAAFLDGMAFENEADALTSFYDEVLR
jgi:hypothetical protein